MTKKRVWRFYCEFCGKSGCAGGHISTHERSCTANPNRVCKMHAHTENQTQRPIAELIAILAAHATDKNWDKAVEELRAAADSCPVCMLSAIRQSKMQYYEWDEDGISEMRFPFDFKAEMKSFWQDVNEANAGYY